MIYPANFETKVEFDQIRNMIRSFCLSDMGVEYAEKIRFNSNYEKISSYLDQVMEFKTIFENGDGFPANDYFDLRDELNRLSVEGTFISVEDLFNLKTSLQAIREVVIFIKKYKIKEIPNLKEIVHRIHIEPDLLKKITSLIDDRGNLKDNASTDLSKIRKMLKQKRSQINAKINRALKYAKSSGWVAGDIEVTIRDGRQVIPIPATHKRKIPGMVVDESSTGQTVFLEPTEVMEIHNEVRELMGTERREIIRILKSFTDYLRPEIPVLINAYLELGLLDMIRAKAKLTLKINGIKPVLKKETVLNWKRAIHPLLFLKFDKINRKVVPLDIALDTTNRILVISGPNAGGKSVCLKTVGLLQYMIQCGIPVPVKENSVSGIFKQLFIDIGDEQSLENDLSTYSSHLVNMNTLVEKGNSETLFLIDEFGTGTEPQLGGAIAETILEELNKKKCFGVITTHYSNLKLLAGEGNGIINGAMLFDNRKMEPLYQLLIGKPGSSFAFEIARKIGFPDEILENAGKKTGKKQLDFDQQLQQLDIERKQLDKQQQEFKVADQFLSELIEKYQNLKDDLERKKKKIIADAHDQAYKLLDSSNKLIEHTIKEIRENQAEKQKTRQLRKKVWAEKENLKNQKENDTVDSVEKKSPKKDEDKEVAGPVKNKKISIGDIVSFPEQDLTGEVLTIEGDELVIGFNSITFRTQIDKVNKIRDKETKKNTSTKKTAYTGMLNDMNDKLANFKLQLDVRGKRGEEAMELVKQYLDDAILLNMREVRILHGKGYGILRNIIHDFLRKNPAVKKFGDEHIERGGHGITIVILK